MNWRPLTYQNDCPAMKTLPDQRHSTAVKYRITKGSRVECSCGVSGPFVSNKQDIHEIERDAWSIWNKVTPYTGPTTPPPMRQGDHHGR